MKCVERAQWVAGQRIDQIVRHDRMPVPQRLDLKETDRMSSANPASAACS
jgi:hypothetical protein